MLEAVDGSEGLDQALKEPVDMILLDIMLPGINGYEICRKIKMERPELPVIMLTARGGEIDKVAGLDIGADDYITKPFSVPELLARIRAVFRRYNTGSNTPEEYTFGKIKLDFKKYRAFRENREIKLSSKEFEIMAYFIKHQGEVVHRHDLLDEVWGYDTMPTTRTVDNFILDLRKKLEDNPSEPQYITSIRGTGYRFDVQ